MTDKRDRKLAEELDKAMELICHHARWSRKGVHAAKVIEPMLAAMLARVRGEGCPESLRGSLRSIMGMCADEKPYPEIADAVERVIGQMDRGEGVYRCEDCKIDWQPELVRRATIPCGECGKQCAPPPEKEEQKP